MHRSGTSALTRVINMLGVQVPQTLMGGNASNPSGHWESKVVRALNDDLLTSGGSEWHDWTAFPEDWYGTAERDAFHNRALDVLRDEFGPSPLVVFKDPRICRIFPFWKTVFQAAGWDTKIILSMRHPMEIAASLEARNGLSPIQGVLAWLRHVLEAEYTTRDMVRTTLFYDELLTKPHALVDNLQSTFGLSWPNQFEHVGEKIENFIDPALRNHAADTQHQVIDAPILGAWLGTVHNLFLRWSEDGEQPADYATLDAIHESFNTLQDPLRDVLANLFAVSAEAKTVRDDLAKRDVERTALLEKVDTLDGQFKDEIGDLRQQISTLQAQLDQAEKAKRHAIDKSDTLQDALEARTLEQEASTDLQRQLTHQADLLQSETDALRKAAQDRDELLADAVADRRQLQRDKEALQDKLRLRDAENADMQALEKRLRGDIDDLRNTLRQNDAAAAEKQRLAEAEHQSLLRKTETLESEFRRRDAQREAASTTAEIAHQQLLRDHTALQDSFRRQETELTAVRTDADETRRKTTANYERHIEKLDEMHAAIQKKDIKIAELTAGLHRAENQLQQASQTDDTLRKRFEGREAEIRAAADNVIELEQQVETLRASLDKKQIESDKHAADLNALLIQKENEINAQHTALRDAQDKLSQTESALRQRSHETDQTAAELRALRDTQEQERATLNLQISALNERIARHQSDLDALQAQSTRELEQRFEEISALTRQLMDRENVLGAERADLAETVATLTEQLKAGQDTINNLANENSILLNQSREGHGLAGRVFDTIRAIVEDDILGRAPLRRIADKRKARLLQAMGLFDAAWYANFYTDVQEAGADPALHFIRHGFSEGRAATPEMIALQNGKARDGAVGT